MSTQHGHSTTIERTRALCSPLPADEASLPVDPTWLSARALDFARVAGMRFLLVLDAGRYGRLTGQQLSTADVGRAYLGPANARLAVPLLYLQPAALASRGDADQVLAHEVTHLKWPSYGHKVLAFERAQWLLNQIGGIAKQQK